LGTGDDRLNQAVEAVAVGSESRAQRFDGRLVRERQAAPQRVGEQLATEILNELLLTLCGQIAAQAVESRPFAAVGERRLRLDRVAAKVESASFADRTVTFE